MPSRNQISADSMRTRLRVWFASHPGDHTPAEVVEALGITDPADRRRAKNTLAAMARDGVLSRVRPEGAAPQGPGVRYAMPTA